MTASNPTPRYALGSTDHEHERIIRQAARLGPVPDRLFPAACIGAGPGVLDIRSGVGDVAMLAANLVGSTGEVVGIERASRSIARASSRVAEAGLHNVSFTQFDVNQVVSEKLFDAAVGRFILQFLPDPVAVLHSLSRLIRPGGVLAFHEVSYAPFLLLSAHLPLWSAAASLIHGTLQSFVAMTEIGLAQYRFFQEAGLPAPTMRMEILLGGDPEFTRWTYDLLRSLRLQIQQLNLSLNTLGD